MGERIQNNQWAVLAIALSCATFPLSAVTQESDGQAELQALREKVAELDKLAVRTQSHIMMDVEYHFSNLWFAARAGQWDLAAFYLRETSSHLDWTVRVRPVRSIRGGGSVELAPFQQAITQGGFARIETALQEQDIEAFESAYRETLPQCHACHLAGGLGYLDPQVPDSPPSALMIKTD